jgi:hypothetical protein
MSLSDQIDLFISGLAIAAYGLVLIPLGRRRNDDA